MVPRNSRDSDTGPHSRLSSPPPLPVTVRWFIAGSLPPSSSLVHSRLHMYARSKQLLNYVVHCFYEAKHSGRIYNPRLDNDVNSKRCLHFQPEPSDARKAVPPQRKKRRCGTTCGLLLYT